MKTNILVSAVIAGVIALTGAAITWSKVPAPQASDQTSQDFGSLPGPNIASPFLNWGGVTQYNFSAGLTQGASTTCSFQSPSATSTLTYAGIRFDTATSSGTMFIEMGQAANQYSTTTLIGTKYVLVNSAQDFIEGSTTPQAGKANVFAPNQYFNIKIGGSQAITAATKPVGRCEASFVTN